MISYKDISSNKNKIMNKGPSIFKEYVKHVADYKQKYGENTVVLMQVGSFYEIYAVLMIQIMLVKSIYMISVKVF